MTGIATPSLPDRPKEVIASGPLTVNATFSTTDNSFFNIHNEGLIEGYVYFSVLRADGTALSPPPKLEELSLYRLEPAIGASQAGGLSELVTINPFLHRVSFMDRPSTDIDQIYIPADYINKYGEPPVEYLAGYGGLKYLAYMLILTRGALKHPPVAGFSGTAFLSVPVLALDDNDRVYLKRGIEREADTEPLPVKFPFPLSP
ncbi:hypothetical protein [Paraburkholderia sp. BL17N1]|uniref:hypothetical protein n=1 Tax=Paraburkholderia sp. BL17N1 TaxID=1938798 RepID=UPI000EB0CF61|nr:hypothetical protein [Paraburkholderia sp. BL17N1]RKR31687.1 hypothetical protein B0G82_7922 [Paraburkholderia sp. BL17N1]